MNIDVITEDGVIVVINEDPVKVINATVVDAPAVVEVVGGFQGPAGTPGTSLMFVGTVPTSADLPDSGGQGEIWLAEDTGHGWTWKLGIQPAIFAPLYIYPSYLGWWQPYYDSPPDYGVVNIANGPGGAANGDYTTGINTLRGLGTKIYGYVDTNFGARAIGLVQADVDLWDSLYNIDGIFFDRVATDATKVGYMSTAATYVRVKDPTWKVAYNHGDYPLVTDYVDQADFSVVFENTYTVYSTFTIPGYAQAYVNGYPKSQWVHLLHSTPDEVSMEDGANRANAMNIGNYYATADASFAEIPPYYPAEFVLGDGWTDIGLMQAPPANIPIHANNATSPPGTWAFQERFDPDTGALYKADGFGNWLGTEPPIVGGVAPQPRMGRIFVNVNTRRVYVGDGSQFLLMFTMP